MPATRYLMFSGVGRSGTTIMRKSIGLHPDICYNGMENNVVQDLLRTALNNCTADSRRSAMAVDQDSYDRIFREAIEQLIWPEKDNHNKKCLMAATNLTPDIAEYIGNVFSDCKIVGLIRDGMEVVSSRMRYPSFTNLEFKSHCETWIRAAEMAEWGNGRECFRLFRYEWLSDNDQTRNELSKIFLWLGLDPLDAAADQMLTKRFHATDDEGTVQTFNQDATDRIRLHQDRADRWNQWSDEQREQFESICGDAMKRLGYKLPWRLSQ